MNPPIHARFTPNSRRLLAPGLDWLRPACRFGGKDGRVALDQLRTVDRERLRKRLGVLTPASLTAVFDVLAEMFEFS